jgi:hypothetical protein
MKSSFLIWLSGADTEVLEDAPRERRKYVGVGGIVLTTSVLAAVSCTFALRIAVHLPLLVALIAGIAWGLAIMNLDRWLISATLRQKHWYHNFALALPRVILALIIGAAVSTPLVLQVFDSEIKNELEVIHRDDQETFRKNLDTDPRFVGIPGLEKRIVELNKIVDTGIDQSVVEKDATVVRIQGEIDELQPRVDAARDEFIAENSGEGGTGKPGRGPVWLDKKQKFDDLNGQLIGKQNELVAARNAVVARLRSQEDDVRRTAQAELKAKSAELERLQEQKKQAEGAFTGASEDSNGLLARLEALDHLGQRNGTMRAAHLVLLALITAIEILPIFTKFLMTIGRQNAYERIAEDKDETDIRRIELGFENRRQQYEDEMAVRQQEERDAIKTIYTEQTRIRKEAYLLALQADEQKLRDIAVKNPSAILSGGFWTKPRRPRPTPSGAGGGGVLGLLWMLLRTRFTGSAGQPGPGAGAPPPQPPPTSTAPPNRPPSGPSWQHQSRSAAGQSTAASNGKQTGTQTPPPPPPPAPAPPAPAPAPVQPMPPQPPPAPAPVQPSPAYPGAVPAATGSAAPGGTPSLFGGTAGPGTGATPASPGGQPVPAQPTPAPAGGRPAPAPVGPPPIVPATAGGGGVSSNQPPAQHHTPAPGGSGPSLFGGPGGPQGTGPQPNTNKVPNNVGFGQSTGTGQPGQSGQAGGQLPGVPSLFGGSAGPQPPISAPPSPPQDEGEHLPGLFGSPQP